MSETFWAVVVGGLLGGGFSLVVLAIEHSRWKKEFELRFLQTERKRREEQCERIRRDVSEGLNEGSWSAQLLSEDILRLPKDVGKRILRVFEQMDLTQESFGREEKQKRYLEIVTILGEYMAQLDKEIEKVSR